MPLAVLGGPVVEGAAVRLRDSARDGEAEPARIRVRAHARERNEELLHLIKDLPDGTTELMCHPGYTDEAFAQESVYNNQRDRELKILTDPSIKAAIEANGIQLITFADL